MEPGRSLTGDLDAIDRAGADCEHAAMVEVDGAGVTKPLNVGSGIAASYASAALEKRNLCCGYRRIGWCFHCRTLLASLRGKSAWWCQCASWRTLNCLLMLSNRPPACETGTATIEPSRVQEYFTPSKLCKLGVRCIPQEWSGQAAPYTTEACLPGPYNFYFSSEELIDGVPKTTSPVHVFAPQRSISRLAKT